MIRNTLGEDLALDLIASAETTGIPVELALACVIAESGLNPYAERWGSAPNTAAAKAAIAEERWGDLQAIIHRVWADISFGYGQQIVLYHYLGDHSPSVANCLAVREGVFADPARNLWDMCGRLAANLVRARRGDLSPVDGDELLGALVIYNAGSLKPPGDPWWTAWAGNVANYRRAFGLAADLIVQHQAEEAAEPEPPEEPMTAIEDRAAQLGPEMLGKDGEPLGPERGLTGVRIRPYENALLLYVPGIGVYTLPEATVARRFDSPNL